MPQSDITLPLWPIAIISAVLDEEMQAWLVGGAVRDLVLAHQPRDWDFVVTGSGLRAARAVANKLGGAYYALDVERQTGRAIVTDPASGLRVTLDFAALRHATIEDDLLARDFTINAMAASFDGRILDPTGGFGDVVGRVLRMVSPTCFQADGVRLVRAVRLVAQFGLMLEHATRARIAAEGGAITNAAPERVRAELVALVALPAAATALALLVELGLVDHTLPELEQAASQVAEPRSDRLAEAAGRIRVVAALIRQLESVERWPLEVPARAAFARALADTSPPSLTGLKAYLSEQMGAETARATLVRWAALFAPLTLSPDQGTGTLAARNRLSALRFSRAAIEFVGLVLASRGAFENVASVGTLTETDYGSDPEARRTIYRYYRDARAAGVAGALLALAISETRHIYPSPECSPAYVATARTMVQAYFTQRGSWIDPAPLLSGHDLMALGVAPGRPVGTAAALLREAQAVGAVSTVAQARALVLRAVQGGDCLSLLAPGGPA